jgi:glutamate:GABA antiporter
VSRPPEPGPAHDRSPDPAPPSPATALPRVLGLWDVVLFLVTAGVNFQWVTTAAASGPSALVVWVIGLLAMSLPLGCCVIDLASRFPEEGGLYVWTKKAFGGFAGFILGWTYWMSNLPYLPGLLYFAAGSAVFIAGDGYGHLSTSPAWFIGFSLVGLAVGTWMNMVGMRVGRWLANAGAYARWIGAVVLIGAGAVAFLRHGSATVLDRVAVTPSLALKDLIFWSVIAFALTGLEAPSFMGDEIKDARRTIPRAIFIAMPTIVVIYVLGTLAILVALPTGEASGLQGILQAATAMEQRLGAPGLTSVLAVMLVISSLGSLGAWLGAVARIPFVAGIDRYLPPSFGRLHPKWGTPHVAILAQSAVTVVFIVLGQAGTTVKGAYEVLVSLMVLIYMIPFLFLFGAAVRLQFDAAAPPGFFRFRGARGMLAALGLVGFGTTLAAIVLSLFPAADEPNKPLAVIKVIGLTAVMVGSGIIVFFLRTRRATP